MQLGSGQTCTCITQTDLPKWTVARLILFGPGYNEVQDLLLRPEFWNPHQFQVGFRLLPSIQTYMHFLNFITLEKQKCQRLANMALKNRLKSSAPIRHPLIQPSRHMKIFHHKPSNLQMAISGLGTSKIWVWVDMSNPTNNWLGPHMLLNLQAQPEPNLRRHNKLNLPFHALRNEILHSHVIPYGPYV